MYCWFPWRQNQVCIAQQTLIKQYKPQVLRSIWITFSSVHLNPELEYDTCVFEKKALQPVCQAGYMACGLVDDCKLSSWNCTWRVSSHVLTWAKLPLKKLWLLKNSWLNLHTGLGRWKELERRKRKRLNKNMSSRNRDNIHTYNLKKILTCMKV